MANMSWLWGTIDLKCDLFKSQKKTGKRNVKKVNSSFYDSNQQKLSEVWFYPAYFFFRSYLTLFCKIFRYWIYFLLVLSVIFDLGLSGTVVAFLFFPAFFFFVHFLNCSCYKRYVGHIRRHSLASVPTCYTCCGNGKTSQNSPLQMWVITNYPICVHFIFNVSIFFSSSIKYIRLKG